MGPKNNLVHFKSLLGCLLIKSWSSSQHLHAGKTWRVIPPIPSPLVLHFTLVKWFRLGLQDWWGEILALLLSTSLKKLIISRPTGFARSCSTKSIRLSIIFWFRHLFFGILAFWPFWHFWHLWYFGTMRFKRKQHKKKRCQNQGSYDL